MKNHINAGGPRLVRAAVSGELRSPTAPCSHMDLHGLAMVGDGVCTAGWGSAS